MNRNIAVRTAPALCAALIAHAWPAPAAPVVSRLTPPSQLFATGGAESEPIIARFVPGQRFDLQATVRPDPGQEIVAVEFSVDGKVVARVGPGVAGNTSLVPATAIAAHAPGAVVASVRAYANDRPGRHALTVVATQGDGRSASAAGDFEVVGGARGSRPARNVILMLGDGMGAGHRTAARVVLGMAQGKPKAGLAMDRFPYAALIMTASLNSIVTDSAPGMSNYVTGNKADNNELGVWPDDTADVFDNPRVENLAEYLARTRGMKLGVVTTADVFDATPAANAVHTGSRVHGTGIVDQFFDERASNGLAVVMGGGRRWFLPAGTRCDGTNPACGTAGGAAPFVGSARGSDFDYLLPADVAAGWGVARGAKDPGRDLIAEFRAAGWNYAPDAAAMRAAPAGAPMLGLFALGNMNVALDKIDARRGRSDVVGDFGFPDQPMLDEMTVKALDVLAQTSPKGFFLMVEGASIDKQSHMMDAERLVLDMIEFDRTVAVARRWADEHPDTLVLVTADHDSGGVAVIGASMQTDEVLGRRAADGIGPGTDLNGNEKVDAGDTPGLRFDLAGTYERAGFPAYEILDDGYPATMDPDRKMLLGFAADADRHEDWRTNPRPLIDKQQPGSAAAPLAAYPATPLARDAAGSFRVTGQVPDPVAAHTANDIPLVAAGRNAALFSGTLDNTDVFFRIIQALGGAGRR
ncbi:MAG: alkaline phosphatase [Gammaproteobacteria bacterium]